MANFKPNKKTAVIAGIIIAILAIVAVTGTVVFLKDRGSTEAADLENSQVSGQTTGAETSTQNEGATQGEQSQSNNQTTGTQEANGGTTVDNNGTVANNGTEGTTVTNGTTAGTTDTVDTTTGTATTGVATTGTRGTGTTTTDNIQETTITRTEQVEIPERQISEGHYVGWVPMQVNAELSSAADIDKTTPDDIVTTKTGDETVKQGEKVTYVITVENKADRNLKAVEVKDALDDEILDVSTVKYLEDSEEATLIDNVLVWNIDIDAKSTVTIKFEATVKTNVKPGTILVNSVITNGKEIDDEDKPETEIEKATIDVPVTKKWENMSSDAAKAYTLKSIKVTLTPTGAEKVLSNDNNWSEEFKELDKYDENGEEIQYTITESGVNEKDQATLKYYNTEIKNGIITNTFDPSKVDDKTTLTVIKEWQGDATTVRPSDLTITLSDGTEVLLTAENATTATANIWSKEVKVNKYDVKGNEIKYSYEGEESTDTDKLAKYTSTLDTTVEKNTIKVINSYEKTSMTVIKEWKDARGNQITGLDSIDVRLYDENGNVKGDIKTLEESNKWTATWNGLTQYDNDKKINYTVKEVIVDTENETVTAIENNGTNGNYEVTYVTKENTTTITNTLLKPEITVTKKQEDKNGNTIENGTVVKSGNTIRYIIEAENAGNAQGTAYVKDSLPANTEFVSAVINQNGTSTEITEADLSAENGYAIVLGAKGTSTSTATITYTVRVKGYAGKKVTNTAYYKNEDEEEFTPANDTCIVNIEDNAIIIPTTQEGGETITQKAILILDYSSSMNSNITGSNTTRLAALQSALQGNSGFFSSFFGSTGDGNGNELKIIVYGTGITAETNGWVTSYNSAMNFLSSSSVKTTTGTNTIGALERAKALIGTDSSISVVLMTDGIPTHAISSQSSPTKDGSTIINNNTVNVAKQIPGNLYVIGFDITKNNIATDFVNKLRSTAGAIYYDVSSAGALSDSFQTIASEITNTDGNFITTDISEEGIIDITEGFTSGQNVEIYAGEYTEGTSTPIQTISWSKFLNANEFGYEVENEDGTTTKMPYATYDSENKVITFNIGQYMKNTSGISENTEVYLRFVTPITSGTQGIKSSKVFALGMSILETGITEQATEDLFTETEQENNANNQVVVDDNITAEEKVDSATDTDTLESDVEEVDEVSDETEIVEEDTNTDDSEAEETSEQEDVEKEIVDDDMINEND